LIIEIANQFIYDELVMR